MIKFFEYCFYRIAKKNNDMHKDLKDYLWTKKYPKIPIPKGRLSWITVGLDAVCFLSFVQIFNLITLWCLFFSSLFPHSVSGIILVSIAIFVFIFNTFFFNEKKLHKCEEKWKNELKKTNILKGWGVFLYVIGSFVLFLYALGSV